MKTVSATVTIRSVELEEEFGFDESRNVFGLMEHGGMSFIAYHIDDYFSPKRVVARARSQGGTFVLHVGMRMTISADELKRVFKELGIW